MKPIYLSLVGFVLLVSSPTCVTVQESPVTGQRRAYGYTWEEEVKLGKEYDAEIIAEFGLYDDPEVTAYVNQVAQKVLLESHMRREGTDPKFKNTPFTFRVLSSPVVNAFALPGGYIYVTRGLLTHLNNEAQLAVVLGHEIGHVAARHGSQNAFESTLGTIALIGGAILGEELLGVPGEDILNLAIPAAQLLFLRYSRDDERESDKLGVEYSALAGYKAQEGSEFFRSLKRMSQQEGDVLPGFLSSHPDPGDREKAVIRMANEWETKGVQQTLIGKDSYLTTIENMMIGENPREGFVEGNTFYHPDLAFKFPIPGEWKVLNEPSQVVIYEKNEKAYMVMQLAEEKTPQEAVEKFARTDGMSTLSTSDLTINGLVGYQMETEAADEEGTKYRYQVAALEYGDNVYRFVGLSQTDAFENYRASFRSIVRGFSRLTDSRILAIQPNRIRLVTLDRDTRFADLLPKTLPKGLNAEAMAILNQVNLNTVVAKGTTVKLLK
jgi:predicted Zn-dependent protease